MRSFQLLLPAALALGVLAVVFGYLCVHPGYLAPALAPMFALLAYFVRPGRILKTACLAQLVLSLGLFFLTGPIRSPSSVGAAAANAFLFQFTAGNHREADPTLSLSAWLIRAGRADLVPAHRRGQAGSEIETDATPDS